MMKKLFIAGLIVALGVVWILRYEQGRMDSLRSNEACFGINQDRIVKTVIAPHAHWTKVTLYLDSFPEELQIAGAGDDTRQTTPSPSLTKEGRHGTRNGGGKK